MRAEILNSCRSLLYLSPAHRTSLGNS
jgi:hypothetical protein